MSETMEELDLDQVKTIPVKVGGRSFEITQQSRPQIQRVLAFVNDEVASQLREKKEGEEVALTELLFDNYDNQLPAIALIFGFDPDKKEGKEVVNHLKEHLRHSGAIRVFDRWWDLNEIDSFFVRGGKPLMSREMVEVARRVKEKAIQEVLP